MTWMATTVAGSSINLQLTLATANATTPTSGRPHHPIACASVLHLDEDGTFGCEHAEVPAGDQRTQGCIDHSIAILLLELLHEKEDGDGG